MPLAVVTAAVFISIGQTAGAHASTGVTLHVDNSSTSHCSDSTVASSVTPYCTIQAAVNAAQPGDTVAVKSGDTFTTETDVTTSGTAGAPITIDGGYVPGGVQGATVSTTSMYGFNISGVQYVDLEGFKVVRAAEDDVHVDSSQHVTVSGMLLSTGTVNPAVHGVYLQSSSYSAVETSRFYGRYQWDVGIGGFGTSDTVTTNAFFNAEDGIEDTAVPDVAITSNTIDRLCGLGINIVAGEAGLATGSTIENNVLSNFTCASTAVLGDSQEVADADYNVIYPGGPGSEDYYWLATASSSTSNYYTSPAQFCAATGLGCHDLATDPALNAGLNEGQISSDASSAVDSANANAPGELPTDLLGRPRVDDPNVTDTGTGSVTHYDRGAYEYQDPFAGSGIGVSSLATGAYSVEPSFTIAAKPWGAVTTTVDYGDGTAPVTSTVAQAHQYARLGTYTISATMTDAAGGKATGTTAFTTAGSEFTPFGPTRLLDTRKGTGGTFGRILDGQAVALKIDGAGGLPASGITAVALTVTATGSNALGYVSAANGTSMLNYAAGQTIANFAILPVINGEVLLYVNGPASTGTYLVADATGYFTGSTASGYTSLSPARLLDTRNGTGVSAGKVAGGSHVVLTIAGADKGALPKAGLTAVSLNITVTDDPNGGSYVAAYPDGSATPLSSNLNFAQGQTIAAAAIVPVGSDGKIDLYVGGLPSQTVDLVADVSGYYSPSSTAAYVPIIPDRVIDTRNGGGPVGNNGTVTFDPANTGQVQAVLPGNVVNPYYVLPRDAKAFDFNLTVTQPTSGGVLTAYPYESQSTPIPVVSNLNYVRAQTVANFAQTTSGPAEFDGSVDISPNRTPGTVQLIADLCGLYSAN